MRRLYRLLCLVCAALAACCAPFRPLWFGLAFFAALSACTGGMWLLICVRDAGGAWAGAAQWLVRLGNVLFVLWLLSVAVVEALIFSGAHTDPQALQADCVFVLGGGIRGDQPTQTLRHRLAAALDVMQQNPAVHVVVCGGQGADEAYTEASVMYNWLVSHGADASCIAQESQSRNTVENIRNAAALCETKGWRTDNAAVLSSDFHLLRARRIMQACELTPYAIAAPSGSPGMRVLFCIREYFSIVKLVVSGQW